MVNELIFCFSPLILLLLHQLKEAKREIIFEEHNCRRAAQSFIKLQPKRGRRLIELTQDGRRPKQLSAGMGCTSSHLVVGKGKAKMSNVSEVLYATVVIQKWVRRWLARHRLRYLCSWQIFQSLEYDEEGKDTILYNLYADLIQFYKDGNSLRPHSSSSKKDIAKSHETDSCDMMVSKSYKGVHLKFPLTKEQLVSVMDSFNKNQVLHVKYVIHVIARAKQVLMSLSSVNVISVVDHQRLVICGDLHGSFRCLVHVVEKNGLPSNGLMYLFNGDFVDRGAKGMEVLITILLFLIFRPKSVFLNRGNHEDFVINVKYGFQKELKRKYGNNWNYLSTMISDLFSWLPLASVVNNKVFVCHGGISDKTTLDKLISIERHKFSTLLKLPDKSWTEEKVQQWEMMCDLLWSDPIVGSGTFYNKNRGFGVTFGPDITKNFLESHGWNLLIRSHECVPSGFSYGHNDQLLTVFSVSNYYSMYSNKGSFVVIWADGEARPFQFISSYTPKNVTFRKQVNSLELVAVKDLRTKILKNEEKLKSRFMKIQVKEGYVKLSDWVEVLDEEILKGLPWNTIAPLLTEVTKMNLVNFDNMFKNSEDMQAEGGACDRSGKLYENEDVLEEIFRDMDQDGSGSISRSEFHEACHRLSQVPNREVMISEQVESIIKLLDRNNDGSINFNEFLEAYRIVNRRPQS